MKHSKQYFDDIGLIVTEEGPPGFNWAIVALPTAAVAYRTKGPEYNTYKWFEDLNFVYPNATHTVIGYGYKNKAEAAARAETMHYELVELNVIVGINYCEKFYEIQDNYHVPCYHYCNLTSIRNGWAENCAAKNIAVEGAAVYNFKKKELLGVASWSIKIPMGESPVGFAVPNTEEFYKNFKCAQTIASDILPHPGKGYFNWLCKLQQ
ncbi:hypothetical protein O0L34_g18778 [Tuta absoluta]|nr:hypothetical protein O0L34_g18778 [Tuta absoluta]